MRESVECATHFLSPPPILQQVSSAVLVQGLEENRGVKHRFMTKFEGELKVKTKF